MNRLPLVARIALLCCSLGLGAVPLASLAAETGFPVRPVTLVIPFPPGGATDVNGRVASTTTTHGRHRPRSSVSNTARSAPSTSTTMK